MKHDDFFEKLSPFLDKDLIIKEDWATYFARLKQVLPNWPEKVIFDWIYSHYEQTVRNYKWLVFDSITFQYMIFPTEFIIDNIRARDDNRLDFYCYGNRITDHFDNHGTWPTPIIAMSNINSELDSIDPRFGKPYHLIEGHHRLGCLRRLYESNSVKLGNEHGVWLISS